MQNSSLPLFSDPAVYEAWYHTPRGSWIGATEFKLLLKLLRPFEGQTLLDVGCGTGYFSRCFSRAGLSVHAVDNDTAMLKYARTLQGDIQYLAGEVTALPFSDQSFDYCAAITSLCFVRNPEQAIREMLRVSRRAVVIGLLNRQGRLYRHKHGQGAYRGARWDTLDDVRRWITTLPGNLLPGNLLPGNLRVSYGTVVFFPGAGYTARIAERLLSSRLRWGSFLAVCISRQ